MEKVITVFNIGLFFSEIDEEGETKVAGTICIYSEVEPDREMIVIGGPLKEDLVLYVSLSAHICFMCNSVLLKK